MNLFKHKPWHHLVLATLDLGLFVAIMVVLAKSGLFREIIAHTNIYVCSLMLIAYTYLNIESNVNRIRSYVQESRSSN